MKLLRDEVVKELIGTMVAFEEMTDEKDKAEKRPKIIIEFIKQKIKEAQQKKVKEIKNRLKIKLTDPDEFLRGGIEDIISELNNI